MAESKMSSSPVSNEELGQIAKIIKSEQMSGIAIESLGLTAKEVDKEERDNQWKFNFHVLNQWKMKNKEAATRENLAEALKKAAKNPGLNYTKVQDILGVSEGSQDAGRELKNEQITELSHLISSRQELRVLAMEGLGIELYVIEKCFKNYREISTQTYRLLKDWMKSQPNRKVAFTKLCEALRTVNMAYYIGVVLEKDYKC